MKKTLFLTLAILSGMSAHAVSMKHNADKHEVTFDGWGEKTEDTIKSTLTIEEETTFIVDSGKILTLNGSGEGTVSKKEASGSVFVEKDTADKHYNGGLVLTGGGELQVRLNDVGGNIDSSDPNANDFRGDVTVKGNSTLTLISNNASKSNIGGGIIHTDERDRYAVVTVENGSTLKMDATTGIAIPAGIANSASGNHYIQVDGGANAKEMSELKDQSSVFGADAEWTQSDVAVVQNAVLSIEGITPESGERAKIKASDVTLNDNQSASMSIQNADILASEIGFSGNIVVKDSTVVSNVFQVANVEGYGLYVTDHSLILCQPGYGSFLDAKIDATSKVQAMAGATMALGGENLLEVMCTKGGVATRAEGMVDYEIDGSSEKVAVKTISYTTDQLKGDQFVNWYGDCVLDINLLDEDIAGMLQQYADGIVFTLTLQGLDSSYFANKSGDLNSNLVRLNIDGFDSTQVRGYYDGTDTIFSFTNVEQHIVIPDDPTVPEPATATLSLLALAGLCARRRRTAC